VWRIDVDGNEEAVMVILLIAGTFGTLAT